MAVKKASTWADKAKGFVRRAYESDIVMGAINTATFREIDFNLSIEKGEVVVLHRVEMYWSNACIADWVTQATCHLDFGVTQSDTVTDLHLAQRLMYGSVSQRSTANNPVNVEMPWMIDFSTLPGNGLPVPPNPLYVGIDSAAMTVVAQGSFYIYYSVIQVEPATALDMLKSLIPQAF